ncbi:MAG: twin-arginine translocase TatA/TatE family subunit [Planctomycetota bacterium]
MHLAFLMPGPMGTLLILFIALLIFGKNLPSAMRSLGSSVNEFKKGMNEAGDVAAVEQPIAAPAPAPVAVTKQLP